MSRLVLFILNEKNKKSKNSILQRDFQKKNYPASIQLFLDDQRMFCWCQMSVHPKNAHRVALYRWASSWCSSNRISLQSLDVIEDLCEKAVQKAISETESSLNTRPKRRRKKKGEGFISLLCLPLWVTESLQRSLQFSATRREALHRSQDASRDSALIAFRGGEASQHLILAGSESTPLLRAT